MPLFHYHKKKKNQNSSYCVLSEIISSALLHDEIKQFHTLQATSPVVVPQNSKRKIYFFQWSLQELKSTMKKWLLYYSYNLIYQWFVIFHKRVSLQSVSIQFMISYFSRNHFWQPHTTVWNWCTAWVLGPRKGGESMNKYKTSL